MVRTVFICLAILMITVIPASAQDGGFKVGERSPSGGFIFYDKGSYSDGWRYLEAAPTDFVKSAWSNVSQEAVGTTSTDVGSGQSNTEAIIAQTGHMMSAARRCKELQVNGVGGWFLPSKDELDLMFWNLCHEGKGEFPVMAVYWSSSENRISDTSAWGQQFYIEGYQDVFLKQLKVVNVRCARAF